MQRTKKSIRLTSCIVDHFVPPEGHFLDPYAGTTPSEIASLANNRSCTSIAKDDVFFEIALSRVTSLAKSVKKPEASRTEKCSTDVYETVREVSQSDNVCCDRIDEVIYLIRNEDEHQLCQNQMKLNRFRKYHCESDHFICRRLSTLWCKTWQKIHSEYVMDVTRYNLSREWVGKMKCTGSPSVSKLPRWFPEC